MTLSAELTRFLADHATAESWVTFTNGVGTAPTAASLAAAMRAKGYQIGEAEVVAALEFSKQLALTDRQLDAVVGGQGTPPSLVDQINMNSAADNLRQQQLITKEQTQLAELIRIAGHAVNDISKKPAPIG